MKRQITQVPKDKDILVFIAEECKRQPKSWIFLHTNVLGALSLSADKSTELHGEKVFFWEQYPARELASTEGSSWSHLNVILDNRNKDENGKAFIWYPHDDPEEVIFLQMEE